MRYQQASVAAGAVVLMPPITGRPTSLRGVRRSAPERAMRPRNSPTPPIKSIIAARFALHDDPAQIAILSLTDTV